jgi:hypothetical protein
MEESALALVLKECLAAVEQGGEPEGVADRYPAERSEILSLLKVAVRLRAASGPAPISIEFLRGLGARLQEADLRI